MLNFGNEMAKNKNSLESVISDWLKDVIEQDELLEKIKNLEDIKKTIELSFDNDSFLQGFGFDQITRTGNLQSFRNVLNNLCMLDVVSVNTSFSLKTGEILKPDLVCFNAETRSFVIFEIKRDGLTERQAITELAGYEQELRNILPFSSDCEINLVLISTEWDDLLTHAISSYNTWGKKNCLALKIEKISEKDFELNILIPNAWTFRGGIGLPKTSLQTIDLLITDTAPDIESDFIPSKIELAIKMIAKQSDLKGINGFISVWKDYSPYRYGQWGITLCCIDSLVVSEYCNQTGVTVRESSITKYINKFYLENSGVIRDYLIEVAKSTYPILKEKYEVEFANLNDWEHKKYYLKKTTKPIYFDFFGNLGVYALNFISSAVVRNVYLPFLKQSNMDWSSPIVANIILNEISNTVPLMDGRIWCSSAFKIGVILGNYDVLIQLSDNNQGLFENRIEWDFLGVMSYVVEMHQIYLNTKRLEKPLPIITNKKENRLECLSELRHWILEELISNEYPLHQFIFRIGYDGAFYFYDSLGENQKNEILKFNDYESHLVGGIKMVLNRVLGAHYSGEIVFDKKDVLIFDEIGIDLNIPIEENKKIVEGVDSLRILNIIKNDEFKSLDNALSPIYHQLVDSHKFSVDWEALRLNYIQTFESGESFPAISVQQNGKLILQVLDEKFQIIGEVKDPYSEVIFISDTSGASIAQKISWEELKGYFE